MSRGAWSPAPGRACRIAGVRARTLAAGLLVSAGAAWGQAADTVPLTVRPGDTLEGLSRELLQPGAWRPLARLNGLSQPDVLHPGQVLRVPVRLLRQQPVPATVSLVTGEVLLLPPAQAAGRDGPRSQRVHRTSATPAAHVAGVRSAEAQPADPPAQVLAAGQAVPEGARIAVGPRGSAVLQLADGSRVKLLPDSVAALSASRVAGARAPAASRPVSAVAEGAPATAHEGWFVGTMRLLRGSMEVLASKAFRAKPLEVETPTAVLGVRGTHYRVNLAPPPGTGEAAAAGDPRRSPVAAGKDAGWVTTAEVLEGRVAAAATVLGAGQGARVAAQGRPTVRPLPDAPDLSALPTRFERPLVSWAAPADAAVRVQVAADAGFDAIVLDRDVAAGAPVRLDGLPDGLWHVRMRRLDDQGIAGQDATARFELDARPEPPPTVSPRPGSKHPVGAVAFAWAEALGMEAYALEVARDAAFTQRVALVDAIPGAGQVLDLPDPGRYHWRVRAIGPQDDRGPWGDAQMLDVRPDPLPPQTRHDADGSLVLTWGKLPGSDDAPAAPPTGPQPRWQAELAADAAFEQLIASVDLDEPQWRLPPPRWGRAVAPGVAAEGRAYFRYRTIEPDGYVSRPSQPVAVELPRDPVAPWLLLAPLLLGL